jgi:peptidoglycan L-alanyl-D-glutamate endopeptidase CwlK
MDQSFIIDSEITHDEACAQNPHFPAPDSVLEALRVLTVTYFGFDDKIHCGQIVIHQSITQDIESFFSLATTLNFPIEKVIPIGVPRYAWSDDRSCEDNNSSGFNYRYIHGTTKLSNHALGFAFDINPVQNIYVKFDQNGTEVFRAPATGKYDPAAPGTLTADHPLVTHMRTLGWIWGGDWTKESGRIDYQHFEKQIKKE